MVRFPIKPVVLFGLALLLTVLVCEPTYARRGRSNSRAYAAAMKAKKQAMIKAAQSQYAAAESVISAAQASGNGATARLQDVLAKMTSSSDEMREALTEVRTLTKDLAEAEEDILAEQKPDSEYAQLAAELKTLQEKMKATEQRLLNSPEFVSLRATSQATAGAIGVIRLREETLQRDHEYPVLKERMSTILTDLSRVKHQLFADDSEWQSLHEQLVDAQRESREHSAEVYAAAPDKNRPLADIKDAKQAIAVATAMRNQAMAVLRSLGASPKSSTGSSSSKSK